MFVASRSILARRTTKNYKDRPVAASKATNPSEPGHSTLGSTFSRNGKFPLMNRVLVFLALVLRLRPSSTRVVPEPGSRPVEVLQGSQLDVDIRW